MIFVPSGPAEELDGGGGGVVGELEDLFDVVGGYAEAGVVEVGFDEGGGRGGNDLAEELELWGEVWGCVRWEGEG